jgi:hypothetical protein
MQRIEENTMAIRIQKCIALLLHQRYIKMLQTLNNSSPDQQD